MALFQDPLHPHSHPHLPDCHILFLSLLPFTFLLPEDVYSLPEYMRCSPIFCLSPLNALQSCHADPTIHLPPPPPPSPSISMCQSTCGLNLSGKPEPLQPSLKSPPLTAWWLLPPIARCRRGVREKRSELLRA